MLNYANTRYLVLSLSPLQSVNKVITVIGEGDLALKGGTARVEAGQMAPAPVPEVLATRPGKARSQ